MRVILAPPRGAAAWRVLRRTTDTITGPDDAGAVVVADWDERREALVDIDGLPNGTPQFYRVFYRTAAGAPILPALPARSVTPAATAQDTSTDVLTVLRDRLEQAMGLAVLAGDIKPRSGRVLVVKAPSMALEKVEFPMVSVHLENDRPTDRATGDAIQDTFLDSGEWDEAEGWMADLSINVMAVSLNPDERNTLGRIMRHAIISNLPILHDRGALRPAFSLSHTEMQPNANAAPLFVAAGIFTCQALASTTALRPAVADVTFTATVPETTHG